MTVWVWNRVVPDDCIASVKVEVFFPSLTILLFQTEELTCLLQWMLWLAKAKQSLVLLLLQLSMLSFNLVKSKNHELLLMLWLQFLWAIIKLRLGQKFKSSTNQAFSILSNSQLFLSVIWKKNKELSSFSERMQSRLVAWHEQICLSNAVILKGTAAF